MYLFSINSLAFLQKASLGVLGFIFFDFLLFLIKGGVCDGHMSQQVVAGKRHLVNNDRKRGGGGRKRRRRRGGNSRLKVYSAAGNQIARDVRYLMSVVNVETKYIDISGSGAATNAWSFVILNTMVQGTTPNTRVGQSVKWVGVEFRFSAVMSALNQTPQLFRLLLFVDHQPNAANATITDVYPTGIITPRTVGYLERFSILFERSFCLNPEGNESCLMDHISKYSYHTEFNLLNNGNIGDITKNAYYYAYLTDAAANGATFSYNSRFVFVDN
jgi:hypothetical protein